MSRLELSGWIYTQKECEYRPQIEQHRSQIRRWVSQRRDDLSKIPIHLTELSLTITNQQAMNPSSFIQYLPRSLKKLEMSVVESKWEDRDLRGFVIPQNIISFTLASTLFVDRLPEFPSSLQTLIFNAELKGSIDSLILPDGLIDLRLDSFEGLGLGLHLPKTLRSLQIHSPRAPFEIPIQDFPLPPHIQCWIDNRSFSESLNGVEFPNELEDLRLPTSLIHSPSMISFPPLIRLHLGKVGGEISQLRLPTSLTELELLSLSNEKEKWVVPPTILKLKINASEGLQFDLLDFNKLTELRFGDEFNRELHHLRLPSQLKILIFGRMFNRSISGLNLPSSLVELEFQSEYFSQRIDQLILPASLRLLRFNVGWNCLMGLERIEFPDLDELRFGEVVVDASSNRLSSDWLSKMSLLSPIKFDQIQWPKRSLKKLSVNIDFNSPLNGLDQFTSLEELTLGSHRIGFPWSDSSSVNRSINYEFNQIRFPPNLIRLELSDSINQSLAGVALPSSLQILTLGKYYNHSLHTIQFACPCRVIVKNSFAEDELLRSLRTKWIPKSELENRISSPHTPCTDVTSPELNSSIQPPPAPRWKQYTRSICKSMGSSKLLKIVGGLGSRGNSHV